MSKCFFCEQNASVQAYNVWDYSVNCPECGGYLITSSAKDRLDEECIKIRLAILMKERVIKKQIPIYIAINPDKVNDQTTGYPVLTIEQLLKDFPHKVSDRLDRTISNLANVSQHPGALIRIHEGNKSMFFTQTNDTGEVFFLLNQLKEDGFVSGNTSFPSDIVLTVKGWNRVAELEQNMDNNQNAFVAMWFDPSMETAFETAMKKAIEDAGYNTIRIDKKEHNNKIDDEIIAEIRKSKFVVADFTGQRGGVYFEAGYAMGLGKPVIWTCKAEDLKNVHFDTRQYAHIVWENEEDLYKKLFNRIRATI
ncbi:nucleoside 2-deoxyribosyltransferase [Bacillus sp. ISL-39]|uniref:nucleoside 2-deoxyribosyltransferase n=1 Tax=Bacillus sp. ISL-39 TaxID=2819124 RepID=UPI001BEA3D8C|nr:nucleoside 2-deoxyribosyltransferase [Bacillus sp. ISL-39]MBT2637016.1 nucleoside 2-deoxyribosyltransferase [Bacillus sp. ISL-39]